VEIKPYVLASIGAARGLYDVTEPSTKAWAGILSCAALYEVLAPEGQLLSEGVDRAIEKHKLLTLGAIAVTAGHLANVIPEKLDPYHHLIEFAKKR